MKFIIAFIFYGAIIKSACAFCPQFFPNGIQPKVGTLLCNKGYAVGYSSYYKTPLWSAENLTDDSVQQAQNLHGRSNFYTDYRLSLEDQVGNSDYRNSGYARGHMTPSGDAPDRIKRMQTFLYSNVVPQDSDMNSGPWNQIEQSVRKAAIDDGELYVVTGPIFDQYPLRIGPNKVAVPVALFKIVYDAMDERVAAIQCQNTIPAQCHQTTINDLQEQIGFNPMPGLLPEVKDIPLIVTGWARITRRSSR
ncbi:DNA/RNA non-specific endonuclease [Aristophania vespae]|uniref:DNA/RNA non-specific endonuclease n=1 Tax=Aristophania vespae TaxID=2697033 RepID=UPI002351C05C|nr:DNA/RNA non-specific endonuclease [Aristophania vespae]UMM64415.1 Nuclease [Aristophania vespae]